MSEKLDPLGHPWPTTDHEMVVCLKKNVAALNDLIKDAQREFKIVVKLDVFSDGDEITPDSLGAQYWKQL